MASSNFWSHLPARRGNITDYAWRHHQVSRPSSWASGAGNCEQVCQSATWSLSRCSQGAPHQRNPARVELVGSIKRKGNTGDGRRPFKLTEIQSLLKAATGEWRGLILFGPYTGQRLGDASAEPSRVNRPNARCTFFGSKTTPRVFGLGSGTIQPAASNFCVNRPPTTR